MLWVAECLCGCGPPTPCVDKDTRCGPHLFITLTPVCPLPLLHLHYIPNHGPEFLKHTFYTHMISCSHFQFELFLTTSCFFNSNTCNLGFVLKYQCYVYRAHFWQKLMSFYSLSVEKSCVQEDPPGSRLPYFLHDAP